MLLVRVAAEKGIAVRSAGSERRNRQGSRATGRGKGWRHGSAAALLKELWI